MLYRLLMRLFFFFSSRRRHTRLQGDWSSDVCSSDLPSIVNNYPYENCNAEVMAALLDRTNLPWNLNHALNPNKIGYLTAKEVNDTKPTPGVGPDGVYRDPWGNPYIITLDLNGDGKCRDAFY